MKRIKVLYTLNYARVAGTEKHLLYLLKHLDKKIFEPIVVCFTDGPLIELLRSTGIQAYAYERNRFFDVLASKALFELIRREKIDIVHSHCGQLACFIGKLAGVKRVIETRHGLGINYDSLSRNNFRDKLISRLKSSLADLTLLVAQHDYQVMREIFNVDKRKIRYVANGVDVDELQVDEVVAQALRNELRLNAATRVIGTVARCEEQKGLRYLIQAINKLKEIDNLHFVVVGDGTLRKRLIELANQSGISDLITFTGYRNDVARFMALFDIFVLPSLWEGAPYTILEAMAQKKPVITTNVFGNKELVVDRVTGLLVPPRDSKAIANAIQNGLGDLDRMKKMGKAGYERVSEFFCAQKMTREIEKIYVKS